MVGATSMLWTRSALPGADIRAGGEHDGAHVLELRIVAMGAVKVRDGQYRCRCHGIAQSLHDRKLRAVKVVSAGHHGEDVARVLSDELGGSAAEAGVV